MNACVYSGQQDGFCVPYEFLLRWICIVFGSLVVLMRVIYHFCVRYKNRIEIFDANCFSICKSDVEWIEQCNGKENHSICWGPMLWKT